MSLYLGVVLFTFLFTCLTIIPYIDYLYNQRSKSKNYPPTGGGVLIVCIVGFVFWAIYSLFIRLGVFIEIDLPGKEVLDILLLTLTLSAVIGLHADLNALTGKVFSENKYQLLLFLGCLVIGFAIFFKLNINFINIPVVGPVNVGQLYPFIIGTYMYLLSRGVDKTAQIPGLAVGCYIIILIAFWVLLGSSTPTPLALLISVLSGCLIGFQYFNIIPVRLRLGKTGSYFLGTALAVMGVLSGKLAGLLFISLIFFIASIFDLLPHKYQDLLKRRNWADTTFVMRCWLLTLITAVFGLWISTMQII